MKSGNIFQSNKGKILGVDSGKIIKTFFASNATVAIVVLALITYFLFQEGFGFIHMYRDSLKNYSRSGMQYVNILQEGQEKHTQINRFLNDIKADWIRSLIDQGKPFPEVSKITNTPENRAFFKEYRESAADLREFVQEKMELAINLRDQYITNENLSKTQEYLQKRIDAIQSPKYSFNKESRKEFAARLGSAVNDPDFSEEDKAHYRKLLQSIQNNQELPSSAALLFASFLEQEKSDIVIIPIDNETRLQELTGDHSQLVGINQEMLTRIEALLKTPLQIDDSALQARYQEFASLNQEFIAFIPQFEKDLSDWKPDQGISVITAFGMFITGKDWLTASDQQDWYGLLPLLTGSLLISGIALLLAVPFGVGCAIYVNQIATVKEKNFIKPYIELISAIPSVVMGFFGVVVLGEGLRVLSQWEFLSWIPFFPIQERLNALTAGCLLALMAVPTIFTLAEDAINNVPKHFKEASFAMGANRLQTTFRVILPTALSGIISAIMLGFGRVIGETMVVLLVAGNRIKIPDFTKGLGVFTEPVHTMTGIIAQEMGEVVNGSLHYRALFMVGIILFFLSLLINYFAQLIVRKFSNIGD